MSYGLYGEIWLRENENLAATFPTIESFADTANTTAIYAYDNITDLPHPVTNVNFAASPIAPGGALCDRNAADQGIFDVTDVIGGTNATVDTGAIGTAANQTAQRIRVGTSIASGQTVRIWTCLSQSSFLSVRTLTLAIHESSGGDPASTTIGSTTQTTNVKVTPTGSGLGMAWIPWDITLTAEMTGGVGYFLYMRLVGPDSFPNPGWAVRDDAGDTGSHGDQTRKIWDGAAWNNDNNDLLFMFQFKDSEYMYEVDLGSVPINHGRMFAVGLAADDETITYELFSSSVNLASVVTRGPINPGDTIPVLHRFIKIKVSLPAKTTNKNGFSALLGLNVVFPEKIVKLSTGPIPIDGTQQIIKDFKEPAIKVDLGSMQTKSGKSSVTCFATDIVKSIIETDHDDTGRLTYYTAPVYFYVGELSKATSPLQLEPYTAGRLKKYTATDQNITFEFDQILVDLAQLQIPATEPETSTGLFDYNAIRRHNSDDSGDSLAPVNFVRENPIDVLNDLLGSGFANRTQITGLSLIPLRYLNAPSFDTAKEAIPAGLDTAFYRAAPILIATAVHNGATVDTNEIALTTFVDLAGTSADDYCIGSVLKIESGGTYEISGFTDSTKTAELVEQIQTEDETAGTKVVRIFSPNTSINKQTKLKKIVNSILKLIRGAVFVDALGQLNVVVYDDSAASVTTWTKHDILGSIKTIGDFGNLITEALCQYQWGGTERESSYAKTAAYVNATAANRYGQRAIKHLKSNWFLLPESEFGGKTAAETVAQAYVTQYDSNPKTIQLQTPHKNYINTATIGDIVTVDLTDVKGFVTELPDTKLIDFWVSGIAPSFKANKITWTLLEKTSDGV